MQMRMQTKLNSHKFPFATRAVSDALDKCSTRKPQAGAGKCLNAALLFSEWLFKHSKQSKFVMLVINLTIRIRTKAAQSGSDDHLYHHQRKFTRRG